MSLINTYETQPEVLRVKPERKFGGLKDLVIRMDDSFDAPMDELGNWDPAPPSKAVDNPVIHEENK